MSIAIQSEKGIFLSYPITPHLFFLLTNAISWCFAGCCWFYRRKKILPGEMLHEAAGGEASHRQKQWNTQRSFLLPFSKPNYATWYQAKNFPSCSFFPTIRLTEAVVYTTKSGSTTTTTNTSSRPSKRQSFVALLLLATNDEMDGRQGEWWWIECIRVFICERQTGKVELSYAFLSDCFSSFFIFQIYDSVRIPI